MHGIILGYTLHDFRSELKEGDLVAIDNGYEDEIFVLEKIDPRFGKFDDEPDTPYQYLVRSRNESLVEYERCEISKAHVAFFDYHKWFKEGVRILLGAISFEDITHIKGKYANDHELGFSEFKNITMTDLIGLDFIGECTTKDITYDTSPDVKHVIKYFKIDKPE